VVGEHLHGKSHSAYVGGWVRKKSTINGTWRVDLKVGCDSPFDGQDVPTYYRGTTFTGTLWTVPS
jgi:hypothetical protein